MAASTTFILSLFCCCTIAQTTLKTVLPLTTKPTTVLPPTTKSTTLLPPKTNPTTVLPLTTKPTTVIPPTTMIQPTTKSTTVIQPTTKLTTVKKPTTKPTTVLPPTTKPTTALPPTTKPTTVLPLTTKPTTVLPPTTKSATVIQPSTKPTTVIQPTTKTIRVPPPTTKSTTVIQPTTKPTVLPSTAKPTTVIPPSTTKSTALSSRTLILEFKCAANGFITDISGVDKGEVVLLNGSKYCHLNEASCDWKNKTKLNVLHVKGEKSSYIAGGKNAHFYQLECKTAGAFVASANTSMNIAIPAPTDFTQEIKKPTEPTNTIKLVITDKSGIPATKVHIGDSLLLKITGPAGYTIEPISCAASSSLDKDYVLWTNDSCSSKDTAVIENTWNHNKTIPNIVSISMYGFRFVKSNTVVVTCSALFCPNGIQCSSKPCVIVKSAVSRRRKRNSGVESENDYLKQSISTSFTVVDNRIDTSGCSGTFGSVFTYVTACVLMLALK